MSNQAGNYGETGKFSTSIVRKLSSRLFFRALGLFLSLDILLCLLISACLLIYGEGRAGEAARQLAAGATPAVAQANTEGVEVRLYRGEPPGIRVIAPFSSLLPAPISESRRSLDLPGPAGDSWFQRLDNLAYLVFFQQGESTYQIAVPLGVFCRFFRYAAIILLIYQLLTLLSGISKNQSLAREDRKSVV